MLENNTTSLILDEDLEPKESWFRTWFPYFKWVPTSPKLLKEAEENILNNLSTKSEGQYVDCSISAEESSWCPALKNCRIWTRKFPSKRMETPLVMIHGMGAGLAFFCFSFDVLPKNRPVYAIDLPGFGRSSRCYFNSDPVQAENQYISAIEKWRQKVGLEKMILLGHSFGGYLSSAYALKYPQNVEHLILADPWGFPEKPAEVPQRRSFPLWARALYQVFRHFNPLAVMRLIGPFGPKIVGRLRPDLIGKFEGLYSGLPEEERIQKCAETIPAYIYHLNAQTPSGESAFHSMMTGFAWAKRPMFPRLADLSPEVPLSVIYGGQSWVTALSEDEFKNVRGNNGYSKVYIIPEAGHHVYAVADEFNDLVLKACDYNKNKQEKS